MAPLPLRFPAKQQQWVSRSNGRPEGEDHYNMAVVIRGTTEPLVKLKY